MHAFEKYPFNKKTLKALTRGGRAPLDLKATRFTKLPMPADQTVIEQLQKVAALWERRS